MLPDVLKTRPFSGFRRLQSELERLFDSFFGETGEFTPERWMPTVDVLEEEDSVTVRAELPGVEEKDIKLSVDGDTLLIEGEKRSEHEEKKANYYRAECCYGRFVRGIPLPRTVDSQKAEASHKNGVLTVKFPKKEEAKPHRIPIKGS